MKCIGVAMMEISTGHIGIVNVHCHKSREGILKVAKLNGSDYLYAYAGNTFEPKEPSSWCCYQDNQLVFCLV